MCRVFSTNASAARYHHALLGCALPLLWLGCSESPGSAGPTDPWHAQPGPDCGSAAEGLGRVWLSDDAAATLVERPLYCLSGDGTLTGMLVSTIRSDGASLAQSGAEDYRYDLDHPAVNEVQAYFSTLSMASYFVRRTALTLPPKVEIAIETDRHVQLSEYRDGRVVVGLGSLVPARLPLGLFQRMYALHALAPYRDQFDEVVEAALADALSAGFRDEASVLRLEQLDLPKALLMSEAIAGVARRYFERSADNAYRYPEDVVSRDEFCEVISMAGSMVSLVPAALQARCRQLSPEAGKEAEPALTGRILLGALFDIAQQIGRDTMLRAVVDALEAARGGTDRLSMTGFAAALVDVFESGAEKAVAEAVFRERGLRRAGP